MIFKDIIKILTQLFCHCLNRLNQYLLNKKSIGKKQSTWLGELFNQSY